ncbi:MAG: HNH endonuclease signature motif containing protein [Rhodopila sp.]
MPRWLTALPAYQQEREPMAFPERLKLAVKKRADFRCCLCHTLYVEIHHITPQQEGGPDDEDNAAPLCPTCHETYGANPEKRKFIKKIPIR